MKGIGTSAFLGVLLALPILFVLDNDPEHPLSTGAIALILLLAIGAVELVTKLFFKRGDSNAEK